MTLFPKRSARKTMLSPFSSKALVAFAMLAVVGTTIAQEAETPAAPVSLLEEEAASEPASPAEPEAPVETTPADDTLPVEVEEIFPVGRAFFGVRIPNYEGDSLTSLIRAKKMRRVDGDHLDMEDLYITVFDEYGEAETFIEMERAVYDRLEEKLVSRTPTRIWQPQYEMKGDSMTYDSKTGIMIMKRSRERQVEMIIFGSGGALPGDAFAKDKAPEDEAPLAPPTS